MAVAELMKTMRVKFIEEGPDRTLDDLTSFGKTVQVLNFSPQQTIFELRQTIAAQENMAVEDVNIHAKTRVKGFEVHIDVPPMRDTSVWKNGRCEFYGEKQLIFDVDAATKVQQLKELITRKLKIPASMQLLTA